MNSMTQVLEEIFSKAASSTGSVVREAYNFKVCCSCTFGNVWCSGLRDFLSATSVLHSVVRRKQQSPGIVGITGEAPFCMGAAQTHGLTGELRHCSVFNSPWNGSKRELCEK